MIFHDIGNVLDIKSLKNLCKMTLIKRRPRENVKGHFSSRKVEWLSLFCCDKEKGKVKMALDVLHRYIRLLLQRLNKY